MKDIRHSVQLDKDQCHGCTNCIKSCPTQAIRVRKGKAKIIKDRCIDCGECIRVCPYHAKKAITDSFEKLKEFKYNIALPAPTFYGQFSEATDINSILNSLLKVGFDDIFEVALAAEIVTNESKKLMEKGKIELPVISSACPAVVKLISTRFPSLIDNILPVISPMQLAGRLAREEAVKKTGYNPEQIGVFFITPCAAKATCAQYPIGIEKSNIDGAISIKDVYLKVLPFINNNDGLPLAKASFRGVCWANSGGEAKATGNKSYIAVDGIHNVLNILEEIENNRLKDVTFAELLACPGGCVGGPLNVENCFVAKRRIKNLAMRQECAPGAGEYLDMDCDISWEMELPFTGKLNLDDDMTVAMQKLARIEELWNTLPKLDCGSCGSPSCRALAEDIVLGYASENACIVKFKERVLEFARQANDIDLQDFQ